MEHEYTGPIGGREETEQEKIDRWRTEELARAGYDLGTAMKLARYPNADLHEMVEAKRGGCTDELALRIFAPLPLSGERVEDGDRERSAV